MPGVIAWIAQDGRRRPSVVLDATFKVMTPAQRRTLGATLAPLADQAER